MGSIWRTKENEKVELIQGKTPHSTYDVFHKSLIREIASALGLSYEFLTLDFSSNQDARGLLLVHNSIKAYQKWIINSWLQRVWNWRIAKFVKEGAIKSAPLDARGVSEFYKVRYELPAYEWTETANEVSDNEKEFAMGVTNLSRIAKKKGDEIEDILGEKAKEISLAHKLAKEANEANGGETNIVWRDLISPSIAGLINKEQTKADTERAEKEDNAKE